MDSDVDSSEPDRSMTEGAAPPAPSTPTTPAAAAAPQQAPAAASKPTPAPPMDPAQKKALIESFKEFLKEKSIAANASWENALKVISVDARYAANFKQLNEKKQVFNAYKIQKQREDKEEERRRLKRNKEELEKFLMECEYMSSNTKYK